MEIRRFFEILKSENVKSSGIHLEASGFSVTECLDDERGITDELLVAAADAIAKCVAPEQLNANFIIPSVFDQNVAKDVAAAVKSAAK